MRTNIETKLYQRDPTDDTLDSELTEKVEGMKFSTKLHGGFNKCSFRLKADLPEAWEWINKRILYHLKVTDKTKTLWEGRIEDISLSMGAVVVTAYGYYANLSDVPYYTAYNTTADAIIKAMLTTHCLQIDSDQSNIDAVDITIDSAASSSYADIYPKDIVEKILPFSDSTHGTWYFAIWEDRIPYLSKRAISSTDWLVTLRDFKHFTLTHKASEIYNSCYAIYEVGGTLTRTADGDDSDSQAKYNLKRQKVISNLGEVAAASAQAYRDAWVEDHKDIWPKQTNMVLGDKVYNSKGIEYSSSWVRAGEVIRIRDLVPASVDAGSVERDALRTFYIIETEYNVDQAELRFIPDTESISLQAILARKL